MSTALLALASPNTDPASPSLPSLLPFLLFPLSLRIHSKMAPRTTITVQEAVRELDDRRVKTVRPLIPPQILAEELPLDLRGAQTVLVSLCFRLAAVEPVQGRKGRGKPLPLRAEAE